MFDIARDVYRSIANRQHLAVLVIVSVVGAATGPFGSFENHTFLFRLVYWTIVTAVSILFGRTSLVISRRIIPNRYPMLQDALLVGFLFVFFAPPLWYFTTKWAINNPSNGPSFFKMIFYVACISVGICILRRLFSNTTVGDTSGEGEVAFRYEPRLFRRLPSSFKGPILRLSGRDHFVDVVSEIGLESVRMRFSDAIAEMDTVPGYVTHRSHWVSADAVIGVHRSKGKIYLELTNGDKVPVSRKYKSELEQAGFEFS